MNKCSVWTNSEREGRETRVTRDTRDTRDARWGAYPGEPTLGSLHWGAYTGEPTLGSLHWGAYRRAGDAMARGTRTLRAAGRGAGAADVRRRAAE